MTRPEIYTREQIFEKVKSIMAELFELDTSTILMESRFKDDLGLDSIDAIDLMVSLQAFVGKRLQPEEFKSVRTISDLITAAEVALQQTDIKTQA